MVPPRIPEDKLEYKTGHGWEHWEGVLDTFRLGEYEYASAIEHLKTEHEMSGCFATAVVNQYEREQGLDRSSP
jgi:hypothetical protein